MAMDKKRKPQPSDRSQNALLRSLPSVGALLGHDEVADWLNGLPRPLVIGALQTAVDQARHAILDGKLDHAPDADDILAAAEEELTRRATPSLRPVINATGIVLHTGLGRAPLCDSAIEAVAEAAAGYCNLELDLQTGHRGRRADHVAELLCTLTGAQAATVVNNNAAATLLILQALAAGREVIVSRGQLIEIGGSYRLPEVMSAGGAVLREVGTTNRTRLADFEGAINERTGLLFRAHTSNYRILGFTEEVGIADLARLGRERGIPVVDDLGSGAILDPAALGLADEPSIAESIRSGADLTCCSGDKLLGGPQCGLILGRGDLIARIESSPLMRTYRVDKMTLAALEATLREYLDPDSAVRNIPTLAMLAITTEALAGKAQDLLERLKRALPEESFFVGSGVSYAGGGTLPAQELPTVVIRWQPATMSAGDLSLALRRADRPVVARVADDSVYFDLRTVRESDFDDLVDACYTATFADRDNSNGSNNDGISLPILGSQE